MSATASIQPKRKYKVKLLCPLCGSTLVQTYSATKEINESATVPLIIECINKECNYKVLLSVPLTVLIRESPEVYREITKRGKLIVINLSLIHI